MSYRPKDFHIGQRVRIREWDDMEKEFGRESNGSIPCLLSFIEIMGHLCGAEATVVDLWGGNDDVCMVRLTDWGNVDPLNFNFSTHMIEPATLVTGDRRDDVQFSDEAFFKMLGI